MKTELEQLGREARDALVVPPLDGVPVSFLDRADGTTRRRRARVAMGLTLGALLLTLALVNVAHVPDEVVVVPPPLAPGGARPVVLSDGTVIEPGPASDLRLETSGEATLVVLAQGHVEVRAPSLVATTVQLGRWTVKVTSAARFAADTSQLEGTLVVLEGSVELRDGDVTKTLGAGSRFDLFAVERAKPEVQVTLAAPAVERVNEPLPLVPKPAPETVRVSVKPRAPSPPPLVEPSAMVHPTRWTEWVAEGKTTDVLEQALPRLEEVLREQDAPVLLALADAARFQRRDDVAELTCETILRRFPDTAQAATARFTQGRLAEQRGAVAQALAHYEAYDVEASGGALAAEALARRVQLESARGQGERACDLAKTYVTRFPAGPLAQAFRQRCVR